MSSCSPRSGLPRPTSPGNGQGLCKNTHVLREHPAVTVRTVMAAAPVGDGPTPAPLVELRALAPDVEWTMPTGHTYLRRPPPALGWGSAPTPHDPPPPDVDADTDAAQRARVTRQILARLRRRLRQRARRARKRRRSTRRRILARQAKADHRTRLRLVREYNYQEWDDDVGPPIYLDPTGSRYPPDPDQRRTW